MSTIVTAIVSSTTYNLSDGTNFWRSMDDNLAMAPIRRLEERGPLQHGSTDIGFRLDPRIFHLILKTQGTNLADLYNKRKTLLNIFKPLPGIPIQLRYQLDNGDIRQIDCNVNGGIQMDEKDREGFLQTATITLKANDPTFYDPVQKSILFLNGAAGGISVPLGVPISSPTTNLVFNQIGIINYTGTFQALPIITIYGPVFSPTISNLTTGEKLVFSGLTVAGGGSMTIDCRYGYKTVVDNYGTNRLAALSSDSNLATFHLEVDPLAISGQNAFLVSGSGLNSSSRVQVQYYTRYIGL